MEWGGTGGGEAVGACIKTVFLDLCAAYHQRLYQKYIIFTVTTFLRQVTYSGWRVSTWPFLFLVVYLMTLSVAQNI
jgi:hypothetical protein